MKNYWWETLTTTCHCAESLLVKSAIATHNHIILSHGVCPKSVNIVGNYIRDAYGNFLNENETAKI